MKTSLLIISFLSFAWMYHAQSYPNKQARKNFYQEISEKYNSESVKHILSEDDEDDFDLYVDGNKELELLESYGTVIHELLHGLNRTESNKHRYFVEKGITIEVPLNDYYNSKKLNHFVRKGLQDSIFRYGLYVGGKSEVAERGNEKIRVNHRLDAEVMSISQGIYGLLEEFNAYYYGNLAAFELMEYYQKKYPDNEDAWEDFEHSVLGDAVAYYEFKLFMAWYLEYAKKNERKSFHYSMDNMPLRVCYTLLDNKYQALISAIESKQDLFQKKTDDNMLSELKFDGSKEDFEQFMSKTLSNSGMSIDDIKKDPEMYRAFEKEMKPIYTQLKQQLKKELPSSLSLFHANHKAQIKWLKQLLSEKTHQQILNEFRIKGLDQSNYQKYLR
ncbi:MAG: hypothetical protein EP338_02120 [Bacteroidetes bacterium]|nr:MAG: hypothetical protein EP338_02120 [Bacteroidota bacterium]